MGRRTSRKVEAGTDQEANRKGEVIVLVLRITAALLAILKGAREMWHS
jgi:hypothetical protein